MIFACWSFASSTSRIVDLGFSVGCVGWDTHPDTQQMRIDKKNATRILKIIYHLIVEMIVSYNAYKIII